MRHWLQLATRNWRTRPARTALAVAAVGLGVAVVVWVTCCYESVRRGMNEVVVGWIGRAHIIVEPVEGRWALFEGSFEDPIAQLAGVRLTTTRTREFVEVGVAREGGTGPASTVEFRQIEATGVRPDREVEFRRYRMSEGRFLSPTDEGAVVVERLYAETGGFGVGDTLWIRHTKPPRRARRFRVIGLLERRRASVNQPPMVWMALPDVQLLCGLDGGIKAVDVILDDSSVAGIRRAAEQIQALIRDRNAEEAAGVVHGTRSLKLTTTEAQHKKLGAAQGLLRFIMMLLSCVVMMTAFFIIVATMNMGIAERIHTLGLLRCVGMTRGQLCVQVLTETAPVGFIGVLVGVPLGLLLQWVTIQAAPEYVGDWVLSRWGLGLAIAGGLGTTLLGALVPAIRAMMVSPVEATRPLAAVGRVSVLWFTTGGGGLLIGLHEVIKGTMSFDGGGRSFDGPAVVSILSLYLGFVLCMPAVVVCLGRAAVVLTSLVLGLRSQLLGDEIHKAPFRSSAVCCGLMVGLSLIVGLVVWGDSIKKGWSFPREFPDAMLYSYRALPLADMRALRDTEGIADFTVVDDFSFSLKKPSRFNPLRSILDQFSRFMAIDPDEARGVFKLTFIEGDEREGYAKLAEGGHILITREFSQARSRHLGDRVTIWVGETEATFRVAGVIASPGLDIAVSFFNASTYFQTYAVGAIFGTLEDAERLFGRTSGKMMLFNFDLPEDEPAGSNYDAGQSIGGEPIPDETGRPTFARGPGPIEGGGPEERVANVMLERLGFPSKAFVTARQLKRQIDRSIDNVTLLLSTIPLVGMIIAALGVANLMSANVASRSREIGVLRAVGTTKSQVARIVIGEAIILGLLGSVVGLVLGMYLGKTSNEMTALLTGYGPALSVPWGLVSGGAGLATLLCVVAALVPAHFASRSNIVAAMSGGG